MQNLSHSTSLRSLAMLLATLWLCSSCIDEFTADLPESDNIYLVVEGSICGNSDCSFYLSRSLPLNPTPSETLNRYITDAKVNICNSSGTKIPVPMVSKGHYQTHVDELQPDEEYWLEIFWDGNTFNSTATKPLLTPRILDVHYEQPHEDQKVTILITPEAPQQGELQYFSWRYIEDWEIHTPHVSFWDLDLETGEIIDAPYLLNIGWRNVPNHPSIICNNNDYVNGEIRNYELYNVDNMDMRFNYLYRTTIIQRAISRDEYEYLNLSRKQSDEMGGLFTPQPAELPTNIRCIDGSVKVIGYVGVTLNTYKTELYIRGSKVGYRNTMIPRQLTAEEVERYMSIKEIYNQQYRILDYDPMTREISWIERWGVDCTVLGADPLARPEGWYEGDQ